MNEGNNSYSFVGVFVRAIAAFVLVGYLTDENERGPFDAFTHWRKKRDQLADYVEDRHGVDHWVVEGLYCPYCLMFWVGGVMSLLPIGVVMWLAVGGVGRFLLDVKHSIEDIE